MNVHQHIWFMNLKTMTTNALGLSFGLVFVTAFLSGCENSTRTPPKMNHSDIRLEAKFPSWNSEHFEAQVILTFSNATDQAGEVILPSPLNENAASFASLDRPTLVLFAREQVTKDEEAFILTDLDKGASGQSDKLILKPGESRQITYKLTSFYRWGPCGPDRVGSMQDYLQPGKHEIAIRAVVTYSDVEPEKGDHIKSPSVVLKCDFPEWLFNTLGVPKP